MLLPPPAGSFAAGQEASGRERKASVRLTPAGESALRASGVAVGADVFIIGTAGRG